MDFLPIFLNIKGRKCLLVGGGEVAARKAALLNRAGAKLCVVAPSVSDQLRSACDPQSTEYLRAEFHDSHLDGAVLAIAATDNESVNRQVSEAATGKGIPVNAVDQPALCSFIVPAIVDRSPLVVAISSSGSSPVLSRKIKELVETHLPARAGELAAILDSFRNRAKATVTDFDKRLRFWESVFDSAVPELVYSGQDEKAHELLQQMLEQAGKDSSALRGEVYLVGAGPGDPDLLTLKALRLMHKADIVLYDRLVSKEIMARLRPDAEKIHVGKQRQNHPVPQEEINELLIKHARAGKKVLRLKGGDPFIFGRGGEELARLAEAHIPFQIVPGITAASGCASYAGIPLTHRDHAQSVQFVAGHMKDGELDLQWEQLIAPQQTLVFYMALVSLELICEQLIARGKDRDTPVAVVQQGTTNNQRVVEGNLANIAERVAASELQAPTITIIGEVVRLREKLDWFVSKAEAEAGDQARPPDDTA